ncbi:hypothetical protein Tco_0663688, partial [Tanacetum coccineum]
KVASPPIVTTSNVVTPTVEKTNDGFQIVGKKKKRKGKSKSTNGCNTPKLGRSGIRVRGVLLQDQ